MRVAFVESERSHSLCEHRATDVLAQSVSLLSLRRQRMRQGHRMNREGEGDPISSSMVSDYFEGGQDYTRPFVFLIAINVLDLRCSWRGGVNFSYW
jgi:hypothetical protein